MGFFNPVFFLPGSPLLLLGFADRVQVRIGWGKEARWEPSPLPTLMRLAADTGPAKPVSVQLAIDWLRKAEKLAGLEPLPHGAFHPFRRK